ncbi:MAG: Hsp20/alpha crystallin family protein [Gemmatimonadales bacterium]
MLLQQWSGRPAQINRWLDNDAAFTVPAYPAVDVAEDVNRFSITMEVPGVKVEEIKIDLDGHRLIISGAKKQETDERTDRVHRVERRFGAFRRVFTVPDSVDGENIEAKLTDGVLSVTLPKMARARARTIPVTV